ncbi:YheV family putative zinc ribbon protein [Catenovulum sediminis]|uniref:YheV family putative zinc ribbon protein n=1 Tax=Catenovulum sediminis TaxID=1740262 RepID=A0ABV1RC51_9ALTE|nr:YheV family putative zinc ribbon protein [Catenovulum sediminis]
MKQKKRFIAGAVCPKCKAQDSLLLFFQAGVENIECVDCGHTQSQTSAQVKNASKQAEQVIGLFKPDA